MSNCIQQGIDNPETSTSVLVNLEHLANWEEKQMFKQFMEDHSTASFPLKSECRCCKTRPEKGMKASNSTCYCDTQKKQRDNYGVHTDAACTTQSAINSGVILGLCQQRRVLFTVHHYSVQHSSVAVIAKDNIHPACVISQLVDVVAALRNSDDADRVENALGVAEKLVRASPDELKHVASDFVRTLVQLRCSGLAVEGEEDQLKTRQKALVALLVTCPLESVETLNKLLYSPKVDISQCILILDGQRTQTSPLASPRLEMALGPTGAGPWKEISKSRSLLNWTDHYGRELQNLENKQEAQIEWPHNKFPVYAAAFMLPARQGFEKRRQGVDLLGRDFLVLGKLIYMRKC
ncbi:unnamed protein product [Malus baccata var. baccata]